MIGMTIWYDQEKRTFYRGPEPLYTLSPLERALLHYFLQRPGVNLTKDDIIAHTWPDEAQRNGISDDALYQLIRSLRQKLAASDAEKYIKSWRGRPMGGYRFSYNSIPHNGNLTNESQFWTHLHSLLQDQAQTLQLLRQQLEQHLNSSVVEIPNLDKERIE